MDSGYKERSKQGKLKNYEHIKYRAGLPSFYCQSCYINTEQTKKETIGARKAAYIAHGKTLVNHKGARQTNRQAQP